MSCQSATLSFRTRRTTLSAAFHTVRPPLHTARIPYGTSEPVATPVQANSKSYQKPGTKMDLLIDAKRTTYGSK